MAGREVEVRSGSRGVEAPVPRSTEIPKAALRESRDANAKVYVSKSRNYLFSVNMVKPRFDDGGRLHSFPSVRAQFARHRFETRDPQIIESLEKSNVFGIGRDFWLLADEKKHAAELVATNFAKNLETLDLTQIPENILQKLRDGLGVTVKKDFEA